MTKHEVFIDHKLCWGCKTCEVACKQENRAPAGVKLIAVREEWAGATEALPDLVYQVNLCRHCDEPPCADACPEEAISKRDDSLVILNYDLCTGCQTCHNHGQSFGGADWGSGADDSTSCWDIVPRSQARMLKVPPTAETNTQAAQEKARAAHPSVHQPNAEQTCSECHVSHN